MILMTFIKAIDIWLSFWKPQGFKWLVEACSHVEKLNCTQNGFQEEGITEALCRTPRVVMLY